MSERTSAPCNAWRQLLRAANVFTAVSNVLAGYLITWRAWPSISTGLACLVGSSAFIYLAGMVLNDAFDARVDSVERPQRPIPSGRISRIAALTAGWCLLGAGVFFAVLISALAANAAPAVVAVCLALTVVMYNGGLKATWAGPYAMGWCRTLNVLLGASGASYFPQLPIVWAYALFVGAYTVSLTYIARGEASGDPARQATRRAIVTRMLQGFIVLDAIAATLAAGWPAGLAVLALLIPTLLLARRTAMT
jgi:4-hydroxybenzoate polyprenyltransferase